MKFIKHTLIITLLRLLLITSIGLFSIRLLYDDNNDSFGDKSIIANNILSSETSDYQNASSASKYSNIKINLKGYHLLSNQEIIDYLNLDKDYYDDSIKEHIDNGESYYEFVANFDDKYNLYKLNIQNGSDSIVYDGKECKKIIVSYQLTINSIFILMWKI